MERQFRAVRTPVKCQRLVKSTLNILRDVTTASCALSLNGGLDRVNVISEREDSESLIVVDVSVGDEGHAHGQTSVIVLD